MAAYLDNSATTFTSPSVLNTVVRVLKEVGGNPSSLYNLGVRAEEEIQKSREIISEIIGASPQEMTFTSGGTEANNLAIFGSLAARKRGGKRIITTAFEHSSVLSPFEQLKGEGYDVVFVSPNKEGVIDPRDIEREVNDETVLISCMMVNNETGAVADIKAISGLAKRKNSEVLIHVDAVQTFGKLPINVKKMGIDLLSISGHKIYAPKGVGALFCKKGVRVLPRTYGGKQENALRPGTENVAFIAAFGTASKEIEEQREENFKKVSELNTYLRGKLKEIEGISLNSPDPSLSSPYIVNFTIEGIRSETMLHFLEQEEIYVSSGSACAKGEASHVIRSLGHSNEYADSSIRVSFGKDNTKEEIDLLLDRVVLGMNTLVRKRK